MPTLSIVIPTVGRPSLRRTLEVILPQLAPDDEVIVIGDGAYQSANEIVKGFDKRFQYFEHGPTRVYGNAQRDFGISVATKEYLSFMDDDDVYTEDALALIRQSILHRPDSPIIFRMRCLDHVIWKTEELSLGNVSTQMYVTPNVPGKLGKWVSERGNDRESDFRFIQDTVSLWPEGSLVWSPEIIAVLTQYAYGQL
jgi:glycosyltransferase involved in cell wall biosynthesis